MAPDSPQRPPEKPGYVLAWHDEFDGAELDLTKWLPYYLPQWSSRQQAQPNYQLRDSCLILQITEDQQPWCPEFDGAIKASSVQTGLFAGPVGSKIGQLQFNPDLVVREAQTNVRLYTPQYGYFECRARCCATPGIHVSLWMIGYEDVPAHSGEIAVFEVFGKDLTPDTAVVCSGLHPWGDPALSDAFYCDSLLFDATDFHRYAVEWTPRHVDYFVDDRLIRRIEQSPAYPLQLMLSIFERPGGGSHIPYPHEFVVDYVRVYQPENGYE